ncbi:hypothetical protein [Sorangium sp. So ce124]
MLEIEEPAPSQGAHHAPDGVLEHPSRCGRRRSLALSALGAG